MNVENFKRVLGHIKAHPETWNQGEWHCGTAHCFAGHAQIMSGKVSANSDGKYDDIDATYDAGDT